MARSTDPRTLTKMIDGLRSVRNDLLSRLAAINDTFAQLGIRAEGGGDGRRGRRGRIGRPPGSKNAGKKGRGGRRRRGSFAVSGEESVLNFVKSHGKPNAAEVNKHWQGEGRGGKADNALSKLVKTKKLKRVEVKGERGSRYAVA